jgi:coatomer subunit beta
MISSYVFQAKEKPGSCVQPDETIPFLQLAARGELGGSENVFDVSLSQAMGLTRRDDSAATAATSRLNKVTQLTGFSDPVYAEAYVHVNQYDIVLDVLIVNQTGKKIPVLYK